MSFKYFVKNIIICKFLRANLKYISISRLEISKILIIFRHF